MGRLKNFYALTMQRIQLAQRGCASEPRAFGMPPLPLPEKSRVLLTIETGQPDPD
jgi:hypothetical protein